MVKYIVTAVDVGETVDGHASVIGVFDTRAAAEAFVHEDMQAIAESGGDIVDKANFEVWEDEAKTSGCIWDIHAVDYSGETPPDVDKDRALAIDYGLSDCPFCGERDSVMFSNALDDALCAGGEGCPEFAAGDARDACGLHYAVCAVTRGGCGASSGWGKTLDDVADKWNARAATCHLARHHGCGRRHR